MESKPSAAVLQVASNIEKMTESSNSSSRSSMTSMDNHDYTAPLELGLVINALQISLVEQTEEDQGEMPLKIESTQDNLAGIRVEKTKDMRVEGEDQPKSIKREEKVIMDYELDHGIVETVVKRPSRTTHSANLIVLDRVDAKTIKVNHLTPREQERADEPILRAIHHLFNNRFMKAKSLFEQHAQTDPFHALGLGSMVFLKAIMTVNTQTTENAIEVLMTTYNIATAQIDSATKRNVGDTLYQYFSSYCNYIKSSRGTGVPTHIAPAKPKALEMHKVDTVPNGVLRAHVVKAEASLQMAILHLLQESVIGYIKCGLNLRRAYASYSFVWQEYKRMGQLHNEYIDKDTISGIQFGIGSVHLVLASLPQKILGTVAAFGWKADKHLGFALLKLCLEERRARSPMASLMLLSYYTTLTSLCPQILADQYTQPAIESLLDAQRTYPNSAIFLYFAGRTSRLARNLPLSTQSFLYAIETSKNEWAEVEILHLCSYERGYNYMMQNNWEEASAIFNQLFKERYWSQAILKYLYGACLDVMGQRTDAILAFAEIPLLVQKSPSTNAGTTAIEKYILKKVKLFQSSGYQDMDMTMCALEYLYLFNSYECMDIVQLGENLELTNCALTRILEAEKLEYGIRARELLPETPPPQYDDQRGALLLIKASILNAMGRFQESVIHLNWIIDRKDKIVADKWVVPYAYWEVGITSWNLDQKCRARAFWETALGYTNYDFEYRLAMKVNLAISKAEEIGISKLQPLKNTSNEINIPYSVTTFGSQHSSEEEKEEFEDNDCNSSTKTKSSQEETEKIEYTVAQLNLNTGIAT